MTDVQGEAAQRKKIEESGLGAAEDSSDLFSDGDCLSGKIEVREMDHQKEQDNPPAIRHSRSAPAPITPWHGITVRSSGKVFGKKGNGGQDVHQKNKGQQRLKDMEGEAQGVKMPGIGVIRPFTPKRAGIADEMHQQEKKQSGPGDCHDNFFADGRSDNRKSPGHCQLGANCGAGHR